SGNRQYITTGNLSENPRAYIIVMDYANRRRVKLWGTAEVVTAEGELAEKLALPGYKARVEQAILFHVEAWDTNCPQHIPQLFPAEVLAEPLARAEARIAELEAELARLRNAHRFER
ncbi:MAG: pyridoxamine 5'-phosphate oxidase family protein, partial [Halomonas sp.]|nr:pyridoxamine 5'-phosphate oxidase family protein [Halomonas sp.]MDX5503264.1 pyridoxamine 5'-phosphate oxidase family protein [Halomonas sp.]